MDKAKMCIKKKGVCFTVDTILSFERQSDFVNAHKYMKFDKDPAEVKRVLVSIYKDAKRYGDNNSTRNVAKIPKGKR